MIVVRDFNKFVEIATNRSDVQKAGAFKVVAPDAYRQIIVNGGPWSAINTTRIAYPLLQRCKVALDDGPVLIDQWRSAKHTIKLKTYRNLNPEDFRVDAATRLMTKKTADEARRIDSWQRRQHDERKKKLTEIVWRSGDEDSRIAERMWNNMKQLQAFYAANCDVSMMPLELDYWNLKELGTYSSLLGRLPGITTPFLFIGQYGSSFPIHVEDGILLSINYLLFGHTKHWLIIAPHCNDKFEQMANAAFPEEKRACDAWLTHKSALFPPSWLKAHGIDFSFIFQHVNEFVITLQNVYHSGFNLGWNCAESVNFATTAWLQTSIPSSVCRCGSLTNPLVVNKTELMDKIDRVAEHRQKQDNVDHRSVGDGNDVNNRGVVGSRKRRYHHQSGNTNTNSSVSMVHDRAPLSLAIPSALPNATSSSSSLSKDGWQQRYSAGDFYGSLSRAEQSLIMDAHSPIITGAANTYGMPLPNHLLARFGHRRVLRSSSSRSSLPSLNHTTT